MNGRVENSGLYNQRNKIGIGNSWHYCYIVFGITQCDVYTYYCMIFPNSSRRIFSVIFSRCYYELVEQLQFLLLVCLFWRGPLFCFDQPIFYWSFVFLFIFYTAGSYQLSVLYILVYTCQSQSPNSSHHHHHPCFSTSASLFLPCKPVHLYHFSRFHIYALIYDTSFFDLLHSV